MRDDARQDGGVACRACRETRRAPAGRRAASADRAWRGRVRADRRWPESRAPVCRRAAPRSAPVRNGAEAGMLKTLDYWFSIHCVVPAKAGTHTHEPSRQAARVWVPALASLGRDDGNYLRAGLDRRFRGGNGCPACRHASTGPPAAGRAGGLLRRRDRTARSAKIRPAGAPLKQRGRKDRSAGIDERRDLLLGARAASGRPAPWRNRRARHSRCCLRSGASSSKASILAGSKVSREPRQVGLHAVDPDRVGIDMEERRIAELRQRLAPRRRRCRAADRARRR